MIADLRELHAERRHMIRRRLDQFSRVPSSEYFYELAYCLLTPQSNALHCDAVVQQLKGRDFINTALDPEPLLRQRSTYVRFHRTKAQRLIDLKARYPLVLEALSNGFDPKELRDWLATNVRGLGYKESAHFLRNIGYRGLAILDRHILRNLKRFGVIRRLPPVLNRKRYLRIEEKFLRFAGLVGIPIDELDLLFWSMETGEVFK